MKEEQAKQAEIQRKLELEEQKKKDIEQKRLAEEQEELRRMQEEIRLQEQLRLENQQQQFDLDAPLEKSFEEEEPVEEPVQEPVEEPVKVPEMSQEDLDKALYKKEMAAANITDAKLRDNLEYMMSIGYMNFRVNYNLLMRSGNDLVIAVNKLCNNLVTDSMLFWSTTWHGQSVSLYH